MSDRGRGRGPRPEFGSRPLGRPQDFSGRGPLGSRGPGLGNRREQLAVLVTAGVVPGCDNSLQAQKQG